MDNHTIKYLIRGDFYSLPLFFYTAIDGMGYGKSKLKTVLEILVKIDYLHSRLNLGQFYSANYTCFSKYLEGG